METLFPSQSRLLSTLAEVQEGSIVSRILLKKETGSVTIFAFDAGQALSEHTVPYDALVQVLEGKAEIMISGAAHEVGAGEVILMPAHQPHAVRAPAACKMLLTMIRG
jgi:quercetin dioxygenase-like cupin family protein